MLSLFKNWNKGKEDPNSRCSSQPMTAKELLGEDIVNNKEVRMEEEKMENQEPEIKGLENAVVLHHEEPEEAGDELILGNEDLSLRDQIDLALHTVYDPEIPVNIMELGLVYAIDIKEDNTVFITMTLTAPGCPVAGDIVLEVESKVKNISGVADAHVQLTFEPQWNKDMMSEEAKLELGFL